MKIQFMVLIPPGGDYDVRGVLPKPPHHPGPLLPSPSPRPGEEGEQPKATPPFLALPSLPVGGRAMGERGRGSEGASKGSRRRSPRRGTFPYPNRDFKLCSKFSAASGVNWFTSTSLSSPATTCSAG